MGIYFYYFFLGVWLKETTFKSKAKLHELLEEKLTIVGWRYTNISNIVLGQKKKYEKARGQ